MFVTGAQVCTSCKTCDPQATTPGTCVAGSMSDMVCSCSIGYYGDGYVCNPCKMCAAYAFKSGSQCAVGSTVDTVVCTCNAGFAGDGTVCSAFESQSSGTASLIMLVTLPMTPAEFEADENKYIISVAAAASVATSSVEILNVTAVSIRRVYGTTMRALMSTSVQVKTSISSTTEQEILISQGTLNANLVQNGLPSGSLTILYNTSSVASAQEIQSSKSSSSVTVGIIAGIAVLLVAVAAIGSVYRRQMKVFRYFNIHTLNTQAQKKMQPVHAFARVHAGLTTPNPFCSTLITNASALMLTKHTPHSYIQPALTITTTEWVFCLS